MSQSAILGSSSTAFQPASQISLQVVKPTSGNIHPMQSRSKFASLQALIVYHVSSDEFSQVEPNSIHVALSSSHWIIVVNDELTILSSNHT